MIWRFYENTDLIVFHGIDQCVGNIQHSHMDEIYIKKERRALVSYDGVNCFLVQGGNHSCPMSHNLLLE